jgi:hypothetical protein
MPKSPSKPDNSQRKPRPAIADLLQVPRHYIPENPIKTEDVNENTKFILVNESHSKHEVTRDKLIYMIGQAYPEFVDLVKEHETALMELQVAKTVAVDLYRMITGSEMLTPDSVKGADVMMGYYKQCFDVLKSISFNVPDHKAKAIAMRQYERAKEFLQTPENALVNEKVIPMTSENGSKAPEATPGDQGK